MSQTSLQFDDLRDPAAAVLQRSLPARSGHYDELRADPDDAARAGASALRPHWARFFAGLGGAAAGTAAGLADLARRSEAVQRRVREQGITYNVYDDVAGQARPWSLELFPFVIPADEWDTLERGIAQRARLLSWILRDVYGTQALLREGLLPPALVLGSPGYVRSMVGVAPPWGSELQIVACDVARDPEGQWCVVSQRTQAPSGLGYALQNRLIISRMFPEAFRELNVQRLATSYLRLLETLRRRAPRDRHESGSPRIVLLTPGPYNETYFEHAFLARYLGVPLVEGNDLMVRDERLYLKSMHGLERVHALIRRVDDAFCDPLELRADSALGVPALLQVVRAGRLLVANSIGSGFLESPAINGFLPAIARRALGAELLLPSLDSWWCGEDAAREQSIGLLRHAVVKSTHGGGFEMPPLGPQLAPHELDEARRSIEANPAAFTLQSYVPLSQTPTWSDGLVQPRGAMIRLFAIADADGDWHTMPGGLTRVAGEHELVAMQRGASSADTWVMTRGAVDSLSLLPDQLRPQDIAGKHRPVSSRAAENLFWIGRYTERADNTVRFARRILALLHGDETVPDPVLAAVATIAVAQGLAPVGVPSPVLAPLVFERTLLAALAPTGSGSRIASNLLSLRRAAGEIRERLAPDHWRLVTGAAAAFAAAVGPGAAGSGIGAGGASGAEAAGSTDGAGGAGGAGGANRALSAEAVQTALVAVADRLAAITGAQTDRMTRDDGWRMLTVGRQIERLIAMTGVLRTVFETDAVSYPAGFHMLLELFDSTLTYRSLYQGQEMPAAALDLLVLDASNPRSIRCIADTLVELAGLLPGPRSGATPDLARLLPTELLDAGLEGLCERSADGRYPQVEALARALNSAATTLSDAVGARYFSHADQPLRSIAG